MPRPFVCKPLSRGTDRWRHVAIFKLCACSLLTAGIFAIHFAGLRLAARLEQVLLLRSVDLARDAAATLRKVYAHLRLEGPPRLPEVQRHFEGAYNRHALGHAVLRWWSWRQRRELRRALGIDLRS